MSQSFTREIGYGNMFVCGETPSGNVDSSNTAFTTADGYIGSTTMVWLNGQRKFVNDDYYETSPGAGTITFITAPATGASVRVDYMKMNAVAGNADTLDGYHASSTATANKLLPLNGSKNLVLDTSSQLYCYDSINTQFLRIYHDDTVSQFRSSTDVQFVAGSNFYFDEHVNVQTGHSLRTYDSGDTKYTNVSHDGTNGVVTTSSGEVQFGTAASSRNIRCWGTAYLDVGTAWTNFDIYDDVQLLKSIKEKNLEGLPDTLVDKAKQAVSIQGMLSLLRDTILEADEKIIQLTKKVETLEAKIN